MFIGIGEYKIEVEDKKFPLLKTTVLERNPNRILEISDVEIFDKFTNIYGYASSTVLGIKWNLVSKDFRGLSLKLETLSDRKEKAVLFDKTYDSWIKLEWLTLEKSLVVFVRGSQPTETDLISIDKEQLDNSIEKLMLEFKETMQTRLKTPEDRDKLLNTFCIEAEANLKNQTSTLVNNLPFINELFRSCGQAVKNITDKTESNGLTDIKDLQGALFQSANEIVNSIDLGNVSDKNLESKSNTNVVRCYHCSE